MPAFSMLMVETILGAITLAHAAEMPQPLPPQPRTVEHADRAPRREFGDVAMRFRDDRPIEVGGTFLR
jgi:hypothetical protein